jgi:hypothetical protein
MPRNMFNTRIFEVGAILTVLYLKSYNYLYPLALRTLCRCSRCNVLQKATQQNCSCVNDLFSFRAMGCRGLDSVVGAAICYGLDGLGFEFRKG